MSVDRPAVANVLGALGLAVADRLERMAAAEGRSCSEIAALCALDQFLDEPSVTRVGAVLGLSHSGTVRLLERLAADGLVSRGAGPDGRTRSVRLTARGRRMARRADEQRAAYLDAVLAGLTADDSRSLHALLTTVMTAVVDLKDGGAWICRRCNLTACGRPDGRCPTANAAQVKYGSATQPPE